MFDDPGKKLRQLKDALLEVEEPENPDEDIEACEDEKFDEEDAVLAEEPRRPGLRTLVFLLIVGAVAAAAGWWLGWI